VKKSSTEGIVVYIDGVEYIRSAIAAALANSTSNLTTFRLGTYTQATTTSAAVDTLVERFILYNRVISDDEVRNLSFTSIPTTSGGVSSSALISGLIKV
jgi:hypothetical protein